VEVSESLSTGVGDVLPIPRRAPAGSVQPYRVREGALQSADGQLDAPTHRRHSVPQLTGVVLALVAAGRRLPSARSTVGRCVVGRAALAVQRLSVCLANNGRITSARGSSLVRTSNMGAALHTSPRPTRRCTEPSCAGRRLQMPPEPVRHDCCCCSPLGRLARGQ
jgi:hypothetical protein